MLKAVGPMVMPPTDRHQEYLTVVPYPDHPAASRHQSPLKLGGGFHDARTIRIAHGIATANDAASAAMLPLYEPSDESVHPGLCD